MANGVLCDSWGFFVSLSLFYSLCLIQSPFCLKFSFVVFIIIILLFVTFYRNCTVMSYDFVVLLKQTTEVKTLPIAPSHNFTTVTLS